MPAAAGSKHRSSGRARAIVASGSCRQKRGLPRGCSPYRSELACHSTQPARTAMKKALVCRYSSQRRLHTRSKSVTSEPPLQTGRADRGGQGRGVGGHGKLLLTVPLAWRLRTHTSKACCTQEHTQLHSHGAPLPRVARQAAQAARLQRLPARRIVGLDTLRRCRRQRAEHNRCQSLQRAQHPCRADLSPVGRGQGGRLATAPQQPHAGGGRHWPGCSARLVPTASRPGACAAAT